MQPWKLRWFVLEDLLIRYYKKPEDALYGALLGTIDLSAIDKLEARGQPCPTRSEGDLGFAITIRMDKTYFLCAANEQAKHQWVAAIFANCRILSKKGPEVFPDPRDSHDFAKTTASQDRDSVIETGHHVLGMKQHFHIGADTSVATIQRLLTGQIEDDSSEGSRISSSSERSSGVSNKSPMGGRRQASEPALAGNEKKFSLGRKGGKAALLQMEGKSTRSAGSTPVLQKRTPEPALRMQKTQEEGTFPSQPTTRDGQPGLGKSQSLGRAQGKMMARAWAAEEDEDHGASPRGLNGRNTVRGQTGDLSPRYDHNLSPPPRRTPLGRPLPVVGGGGAKGTQSVIEASSGPPRRELPPSPRDREYDCKSGVVFFVFCFFFLPSFYNPFLHSGDSPISSRQAQGATNSSI